MGRTRTENKTTPMDNLIPLLSLNPSPTPDLSKKACPEGAGEPSSKANKGKRKAEPAPPVLVEPVRQNWSPFLVISSTDKGKKAADLTVFVIYRHLKGAIGGEPKGVTKLRSGDLLVELSSPFHASKLEKITKFADLPVSVTAHKSLNRSRGTVRSPDLAGCSEEEMVAEMDGVVQARRIFVRRGGNKVQTNTIVLTFDSPKPPTTVRAGYLNLKVTPYVPRPMRCFNCHRFGHTKEFCRRAAACCRCGRSDHTESECSSELSCVNCGGNHVAISKDCPKFLEEEAILRYRAEHGGTFAQARAAVVVPIPKQVKNRSYASAVRFTAVSKKADAPSAVSSKVSTVRPAAARFSATPVSRGAEKRATSGENINRFAVLEDEAMDTDLAPTPSPVDILQSSPEDSLPSLTPPSPPKSKSRPHSPSNSKPHSPPPPNPKSHPPPPPKSKPRPPSPPKAPPPAPSSLKPPGQPPGSTRKSDKGENIYPLTPEVVVTTEVRGKSVKGLAGAPKGGLPGKK